MAKKRKRKKKEMPTFTYVREFYDWEKGAAPERTVRVSWIDAPTQEIADARFEELRYQQWFADKEPDND